MDYNVLNGTAVVYRPIPFTDFSFDFWFLCHFSFLSPSVVYLILTALNSVTDAVTVSVLP